jgi:glycosyltransferase involved in cell wall biosynthesis
MSRVSVVIPAYREEPRVGATVAAVRSGFSGAVAADLRLIEVVVVDDGSPDGTAAAAEAAGARVLRLPRNRGKGAALTAGLSAAEGELLVMLDADLGESAVHAPSLIEPLRRGEADLVIGVPEAAPTGSGGMGLVKALAGFAVRSAGGALRSPLSGQRALTLDAWRRIGRLEPGFALETGMNLDALREGLRVVEVPVAFRHRYTGRNWAGFRHRGRQFRDILGCLLRRALAGQEAEPGSRKRGRAA